ncbi:MAG: NapC/NirT family cytochrome c [Acidobacteria bacterium]|nr:NapC/NirT family cytochrome c [Acidobacteriota bacterium]
MIRRETVIQRLRAVFYAGRDLLTLTGAVLATSTAFTMLAFWFFEMLRAGPVRPYTGIVFALILPAFFLIGLLLVLLRVWRRRRRLRTAGQLPEIYPQIDFGNPAIRRTLAWFSVVTFLSVAILSGATYRGVNYMNSVEFCGEVCHTVMAPEYITYQNSAHSKVACVGCHVRSGVPWFVRAKISGVRQVFAVAFHNYPRPISLVSAEHVPARETCERCHWPQKFYGGKLLVRIKYSDDEANTPLTTVLLLKLGGRTWQGFPGIHGKHLGEVRRIQYVATDEQRQGIARVTVRDEKGDTVEYVVAEVEAGAEGLPPRESRTMDCTDCHNRPTHPFQMPDRAVDEAMSEGRISPTLPFIKKKAVEVLRAEYPDRTTAAQQIASQLARFYQSSYPEVYATRRALLDTVVQQVQAIYLRNVFPEMNISWGTYPDNIGHQDFPGCFRCHDGAHQSADGRVLRQDCDTCHDILAMEESNPAVLEELGIR